MTQCLVIRVPGRPVPYHTHRTAQGRTIKPKRLRDFQRRVQGYVAPMVAQWHSTGPICLDIGIAYERPKRLMGDDDPEGYLWHVAKPDRDNLVKAIQDALFGSPDALRLLGLQDDQVVVQGETVKGYAPRHVEDHIIIKITAPEPADEAFRRIFGAHAAAVV